MSRIHLSPVNFFQLSIKYCSLPANWYLSLTSLLSVTVASLSGPSDRVCNSSCDISSLPLFSWIHFARNVLTLIKKASGNRDSCWHRGSGAFSPPCSPLWSFSAAPRCYLLTDYPLQDFGEKWGHDSRRSRACITPRCVHITICDCSLFSWIHCSRQSLILKNSGSYHCNAALPISSFE